MKIEETSYSRNHDTRQALKRLVLVADDEDDGKMLVEIRTAVFELINNFVEFNNNKCELKICHK